MCHTRSSREPVSGEMTTDVLIEEIKLKERKEELKWLKNAQNVPEISSKYNHSLVQSCLSDPGTKWSHYSWAVRQETSLEQWIGPLNVKLCQLG